MAVERPSRTLVERLVAIVGAERVVADATALSGYARDTTENEAHRPAAAVLPKTVEEVRALLLLAGELRLPVTARVAGTNTGGLAIPSEGGIVADLSRMNRVLALDHANMYALIEPGVTWGQLKRHLEDNGDDLVIGYPLAPPDTSVAAGCLMDGLSTLTLPHGPMGEWINGLEVVLPSGEVVRTGAGAVSDVWFSRAPLPDLTGLFLNWFGTTGIVTRLAVQLWPKPAARRRMFVPCDRHAGAFAAMRALARTQLFDDVGGLSWVLSKAAFGLGAPGPRDPDEPEFYLYVDVSGGDARELSLKLSVLGERLAALRRLGHGFSHPIDIADLVRVNPVFRKFSDLPVRLDFLLDHPGGGLSWVGTYGPVDRLERATERGLATLETHGFPPSLVSRPMRGGHFAVLRFIELFDRTSAEETQRVARANHALLEALLDEGYLPYKCPPWAVPSVLSRMDPGMAALMRRLKAMLDPHGVLNPGKWGL
jgi:FAD/FMN-containing dehydrogenase